MRKTLIAALCLVISPIVPVEGAVADSNERMVQEVLASTPLVDGHNDAPWAIRGRWSNQLDAFDFHDTASDGRGMHTDLTRLKRGGVGAQFWSVWVPTDLEGGDAVTTVIEQIDLSHVSAEVMRQVLELTKSPVIFSHSSAFAINPHPRNVPDDVLRMVAANGGVVMVNFGSFFLAPSHIEQYAGRMAERERLKRIHPGDPARAKRELQEWVEAHPAPKLKLSDLADHVEHIRRVAGVDHVGLGSDYDGIRALPEGMGDVTGYPRLLAELARRGWTREDLAKVAGENILRVMEEVERVAVTLLKTEEPEELWFKGEGDE